MMIRPLSLLFAALVLGCATSASDAELSRWGTSYLKKDAEWYATDEARAVAEQVLVYQSGNGSWPKNWDLTAAATASEIEELNRGGKGNTIDNDGTTLPLQFVALMTHATGDMRYEAAFQRGLDYLLAAQYENGGWPQYFPLRNGYYSRITFNDNAMMNVMFLLRGVANGEHPYSFVDDERAVDAAGAVDRGIALILKTQIRQNGKLAGWAAQYDEVTLEPAWARAFEPPSVAGLETVAIVRFLMEIERPTPDQIAAIEGAVVWLQAVAIHGFRYHRGPDAEGVRDAAIVPDDAAVPLWARFYELCTNRPIFLGRDGVFRYSLDEIEQERRGGYSYYGTWAKPLLEKDYPRWRASQEPTLEGGGKR